MKTIMVEKRIGEWLGPVDWEYDFAQHGWDRTGSGIRPECIESGVAKLREISNNFDKGWGYAPSDFSVFRIVQVGMYDGWPFWKPTPAIGYVGPLGSVEIAFFYNLSTGVHHMPHPKEQA